MNRRNFLLVALGSGITPTAGCLEARNGDDQEPAHPGTDENDDEDDDENNEIDDEADDENDDGDGRGARQPREFAQLVAGDEPNFQIMSGFVLEALPMATVPEYLSLEWEVIDRRVSGANVWIFDGGFEQKTVEDSLTEHKFRSTDFGEFDLWERNGETVAFVDGLIFDGEREDVERCLETVRGERSSFYERETVPTLLERLSYSDALEINLAPIAPFEGEIANASSVEVTNRRTLGGNVQEVHLFEKGDSAADATAAVESHYEDTLESLDVSYQRLQVTREANLVIVVVEDVEEFGF